MHAWLCENPTGIDALEWKELPTPQPKLFFLRPQIEVVTEKIHFDSSSYFFQKSTKISI